VAISERLLAKLKDPALAMDKAPVAGAWLGCDDAATTFDVFNPSTEEWIATLPNMDRAQTEARGDCVVLRACGKAHCTAFDFTLQQQCGIPARHHISSRRP
jgi:hypothetical protein